jgi:hypothetical protein
MAHLSWRSCWSQCRLSRKAVAAVEDLPEAHPPVRRAQAPRAARLALVLPVRARRL